VRRHFALLPLALIVGPPLAAQSPFDALHFRSVGPAVMGGRIHDVEVDPRDPATIYIGAAAGGIWKTTHKGTTWAPIFDAQKDNTFGDIAIFPGDSHIVWAGTGEQNNRQSSSWGGGVYRSTDAGATWTFVGLKESGSIARVLLHPTDGNVAWVAVVGNLWKPTAERGVFKTTDAGKTWTSVLFVDSLTGANEIVMDPRDPNVLYASAYQRLRTVYGFNGGGPGSALHKSTDGGATWRKIEGELPAGDKGRIGIAVARSNPNVVIATVEHQTAGGTYRSEDAGTTWKLASRTNPRPMYYSAPFIDPTTDKRIWLLGVQPAKSEDGGTTFETMPNSPTYDLGLKDDHHSLWIDPRDTRHLLLGGDGGLHESWDQGITYNRLNNFAIGQFYRIAVDDRDPYFIYGGLQDAHSWMGPSSTSHWLGILNSDWHQIGFSDGTGQAVDKSGPRFVYSTSSGGSLSRVDALTGDRFEIQPVAPAGETYRYDWTAPIVASMHKAGTVYLGANKLLISKDFGSTWTATPDLTRQVNRDTLRTAGVLNADVRLSRNDGETNYSEITTMAESPVDPKVLWVGTDDGNVQLSQDGGKTWAELSANVKGVANGSFVDRIVASGASRGTAYATFDNHRSGDFAPYILRTTDFGQSWTKVTSGLPDGAPVRSITEYPGKPSVLFAGTERYVYFTTNSGDSWTRIAGNLPPTRYDDMIVHPRTKDLVLATHGRSIWVLDDASPFAEWSAAVAAEPAHLFPVRRATIINYWADVSTAAHGIYAAENPAEGAVFSYHLSRAAQAVKFTVTNEKGRVIREFTGPTAVGALNRVNWDLRYPPGAGGGPVRGGGEEGPPTEAGAGGGGGRGLGSGRVALPIPAHNIGPRGFYVSPGRYTVTMDVDGVKSTQTFEVRADPTMMETLADHKARESFLLDVQDVQAKITTATTAFRAKMAAAEGADSTRINALALRLGLIAPPRVGAPAGPGAPAGGPGGGGRGGFGGPRGPGAALGQLAGAWNGSGARHGGLQAPSGTQRAVLARAKELLAEIEKELARKP
jgi:photosystem II stability/assembly factor-like uncharacterized protein